jgi:hypothetical protein
MMTEFETKALELLASIDESLKVLKDAAARAEAMQEARDSTFVPPEPPEISALRGILKK